MDSNPLRIGRHLAGLALLVGVSGCFKYLADRDVSPAPQGVHRMRVLTATGAEMPLAQYTGKVLLIVNVASKCGFTKQYEGLQALHDKYRERDFEILAFPCNQFKGQEPGFDQEIQTFCRTVYGVRFPVFAKIEVNGDGAHPLYKYLKKAAPGLAGTENVKWNFTKFLVAQDGTVVRRFASATKPRDLVSHIDDQLAE